MSERPGILRSLGQFTGHLWQAIRSDPGPDRQVVREQTEQRTVETDEAKMTLRRTTVEEIEIEKK